MDQSLLNEILSLLKYFQPKSLLINELNKRNVPKIQIVDSQISIVLNIQDKCTLFGNYGLRYASSLDQKLLNNIFELENLENCLDICCKTNKKYFKVICLMALYFTRDNIKFMAAAVQLAIKFKFRKLILFGLDVLIDHPNCLDANSLQKLKTENDEVLVCKMDLSFWNTTKVLIKAQIRHCHGY